MQKFIQLSKWILAVNFLLFGMVFSNGCTHTHFNTNTDFPSWYFSPKVDDCCLTSVGMGASRAEALVSALTELSSVFEASISSSMSRTNNVGESFVENTDFANESIIELAWGPVTLKSIMRDYSTTVSGNGAPKVSSSNIVYVSNLIFESGDKKQSISLKLSEFSEGETVSYNKTFENNELNSTLADIIAALESEGIKMTWDDRGENHFLRMDLSKRVVEEGHRENSN